MADERCGWVTADPLYLKYHDQEWGAPTTDARELFEMLCLEGQQAGLSWITVLKKRENYRRAFHGFDPQRVAAMTEQDVENLLQDSGIIRHRGKIEAIITNAKAYLAMEAAGDKRVITTEIAPALPFYYAEDDHQQYLFKNPEGYCGLGGIGVCLPPQG